MFNISSDAVYEVSNGKIKLQPQTNYRWLLSPVNLCVEHVLIIISDGDLP